MLQRSISSTAASASNLAITTLAPPAWKMPSALPSAAM
jgi:hypothetical protein